MFVVVAYDIADDARRVKIAATVRDYGDRVQYSVFECVLEEVQLESLTRELTGIIDPEDSIRIYRLCEACRKEIKVHGKGKPAEDPSVYVV